MQFRISERVKILTVLSKLIIKFLFKAKFLLRCGVFKVSKLTLQSKELFLLVTCAFNVRAAQCPILFHVGVFDL